MLISNNGNTIYQKVSFKDEAEIEDVVLSNYQLLFGNYSILIPKAKVSTLGGKGTIPDGIIINFEAQEWFIIEVERGIHGTWSHIAPQISKQITAFSNPGTEEEIKNQCLKEIEDNNSFKDLLFEIGIPEMKIHSYLNRIFEKMPIIALPIDEIPSDLTEWAQTIKNEVRIWEIVKYRFNERILYSFPDETMPSIITRPEGNSSVVDKINNSNFWATVMEKGLLTEGEELHFDYGPQGKNKIRFTGIVRKNGIEVDGEISSPSTSSLQCIQKLSTSRTSSNGWSVWKTKDGKPINGLYKKALKLGIINENVTIQEQHLIAIPPKS